MQPPPSPPSPSASRIRAIDWYRGLAVLVMIECHALVLLRGVHDAEPLRLFLNAINGLVAPSFLTAAGFSIALVTGRTASDATGRNRRAWRSLRRIGDVLVVATILRVKCNPVFDHPNLHQWLSIDILSCIAYSLLIVWLLLRIAGQRLRLAATLTAILAAAVFFISPITEAVRDGGVLQYFINPYRVLPNYDGSMFPLVPWGGYVLLGAALGLFTVIGGVRGLVRALVIAGILGLAMSWAGGPLDQPDIARGSLWGRLYGGDSFWLVGNMGARVWRVAVVAIALCGLEHLGSARGWLFRGPVTRFVELFGHSSLSAYFCHLTLIYGFYSWLPLNTLHGTLDWWPYACVLTGILTVTALFCSTIGWLERFIRRR